MARSTVKYGRPSLLINRICPVKGGGGKLGKLGAAFEITPRFLRLAQMVAYRLFHRLSAIASLIGYFIAYRIFHRLSAIASLIGYCIAYRITSIIRYCSIKFLVNPFINNLEKLNWLFTYYPMSSIYIGKLKLGEK